MTTPELAVRASSSRVDLVDRGTTESVDTIMGTTKGVPTEGADSRNPDAPAC